MALSSEEKKLLEERGADIALSLANLEGYNKGILGRDATVVPRGVPEIDGKRIMDLRNPADFTFSEEELQRFAEEFPDAAAFLQPAKGKVSRQNLEQTGIALLPFFSYGFLNGGSATSYGDGKKNKSFDPDLFSLYEEKFHTLAAGVKGKPKGITPAFLQNDGAPGPSYMEMKLRSLLLLSDAYRKQCGKSLSIPFFQMTSVSNDPTVGEYLEQYRESPWLKELSSDLGVPPWEGYTAVQPLITAYTHSDEGEQKKIYRNPEAPFPFILLPGGHGQCFRVLKELWRDLYARGIRFISLGNIDNLGYVLDPLELALLALRRSPAGFDESYKTKVDVKGGILVNDSRGGLNCVDLGVGISHEDAAALEASGKNILFNCGSGLFNLEWLLENIDSIIDKLPLRFSDQNKDAGKYSQAEQVTWEVIGMIDNPLIFAVDKYERFLAAKILLENMMTSGLELENPHFPGSGTEGDIKESALKLNAGLEKLLERTYGLVKKGSRWQPAESIS